MNSMNVSSRVVVSSDELRARILSLAQMINSDYAGREVDVVCLSNSATTFTSDLLRLLEVPTKLHLISFVSYTPAPTSGEVRVTLDVGEPLQGRHVLVVEGMVISGRTPLYLMNLLRLRQPASLELCAIGRKPSELAVDLSVKYCLFEFASEWVAGYGIGSGAEKGSPNLVNLKP